MTHLTALVLLACLVTFAVAMVGYVALLCRVKQPVGFHDLRQPLGRPSRLGCFVHRMWVAAIVLSLAYVVLGAIIQATR